MHYFKYIKSVGIWLAVGFAAIFLYKKGEDSNELKHSKKDKKSNDEDQKLSDNVNSLSDDDIANRLQ